MSRSAQLADNARERIQKRLAEAGVGSRRKIEQWIREGRVSVNEKPAAIGQKIASTDRVSIDGRRVALPRAKQPTRVLIYKKRVGELVTRADPEGRRTVFRKLPKLETGRWIAVGRLDINTSGLLLMTNDGELARRLTHPSFEIERSYAVRVLGDVDPALLERLRHGVRLEDGMARCTVVQMASKTETGNERAANQWLQVTVHEGRNRLVRRLFESQGLQVSRLIRVAYGPVELGGGIRSGSTRELERDGILRLGAAVGLDLADATKQRQTKTSHRPVTVSPARNGKKRGRNRGNPRT